MTISSINLSSLNGNDGFDDLIVGASYVVFGSNFTTAVIFLGTSAANSFTGTSTAERFVTGGGNDILSLTSSGQNLNLTSVRGKLSDI